MRQCCASLWGHPSIILSGPRCSEGVQTKQISSPQPARKGVSASHVCKRGVLFYPALQAGEVANKTLQSLCPNRSFISDKALMFGALRWPCSSIFAHGELVHEMIKNECKHPHTQNLRRTWSNTHSIRRMHEEVQILKYKART